MLSSACEMVQLTPGVDGQDSCFTSWCWHRRMWQAPGPHRTKPGASVPAVYWRVRRHRDHLSSVLCLCSRILFTAPLVVLLVIVPNVVLVLNTDKDGLRGRSHYRPSVSVSVLISADRGTRSNGGWDLWDLRLVPGQGSVQSGFTGLARPATRARQAPISNDRPVISIAIVQREA